MINRHKKLRKIYNEKVKDFFDKINFLINTSTVNRTRLNKIREMALRGKPGWRRFLNIYLQALSDCEVIADTELSKIRSDPLFSIRDFLPVSEWILGPLIWGISTAIVTVFSFVLSPRWWLTFFLSGVVGIIWSCYCTRLRFGEVKKCCYLERLIVIIIWSITTTFAIPLCSELIFIFTTGISINHLKSDIKYFSVDPQYYPLLKEFAKRNFNVEVELGDADISWSSTTLNILESSPASNEMVGLKYCVLRINRDLLLSQMKPPYKQYQAIWVQGIMFHEFAHCLDTLRDLPIYSAGIVRNTYAIAPIDAKDVHDLGTYRKAVRKDTSELWREALADIFAVGYWRLKSPSQSLSLASTLRNYRYSRKKNDKTHATMCWIDQAIKAPEPVSEKDLLNWADHLRNTPSCAFNLTKSE